MSGFGKETLCIALEKSNIKTVFIKILLVLVRCNGAGAETVANVIERKTGHDCVEVDNANSLVCDAVKKDVVYFCVVMSYSHRYFVLCGKVNKHLVSIINNLGGKAIGLCGLDGALFQAKKLDEKYGLVGKIVKVEPQVVHDALNCGYIPVVSTVALGIDNDTAYNINADTAAAELAISLGAEKLILLTDVRGVLKDPKDDSTLISQIRLNEVPGLLASGIIGGGMIPKIECCVNALERGVHRTHILDGRIPHSILTEMLSHKGIGTMLWE